MVFFSLRGARLGSARCDLKWRRLWGLTGTSASDKMPRMSTLRGRLTFFSETGTEGGYWAFMDDAAITREAPTFGVFSHTRVWDAEQPEREGITQDDTEVLRDGTWYPLPDPIQADPDYFVSSLFRGDRGDREADARLAAKYEFTIKYADEIIREAMDEKFGRGNWYVDQEDATCAVANGEENYRWSFGGTPRTEPQRPYGVTAGEITRSTVLWEDGASEQRESNSLLVEKSSYDGLHTLQDGDQLTIFRKDDPGAVHWEGEIKLLDRGLFREDAFGMWIHNDQEGVVREDWARPFMEEWPAELKIK